MEAGQISVPQRIVVVRDHLSVAAAAAIMGIDMMVIFLSGFLGRRACDWVLGKDQDEQYLNAFDVSAGILDVRFTCQKCAVLYDYCLANRKE